MRVFLVDQFLGDCSVTVSVKLSLEDAITWCGKQYHDDQLSIIERDTDDDADSKITTPIMDRFGVPTEFLYWHRK